MAKAHVKKGDEVVVIAGSELGKRGKILEIKIKHGRAVVEGLKMIKRHTKKNQRHEQSAIVEREGSIHLSNLMLASRYDERHGGAQPEAESKES
jgi:large subunit ribosomal protein L24